MKDFAGLRVYWYKEPIFATARKKLAESLSSRSIKLFQSNGPSEVIKGILKSLRAQPHNLTTISKCNWVISSNLEDLITDWDVNQLENPILLGPNIEFERFLPEVASLKKKYVLVPSLWVKPIVQYRLNIPMDLIKVWASGVDTQYWRSEKKIRRNVLIYRKYDESDDVVTVCNYLRERNISYKVFEYGKYQQRAFKKYLGSSFAGIWLAGSESQGMALLQAWSMDVPTLVRRKNTYVDKLTSRIYPCSSAPYLSPEAGQFSETESLTENDLINFFNPSFKFHPRRYVNENFTLNEKIRDIYELISEFSS